MTKQIHYENGTLRKSFLGGIITIIGGFFIGYFGVAKFIDMLGYKDPSLISVATEFDLHDSTKVPLNDPNLSKVMLTLHSSGSSPDDIFKDLPLDY